MVKYDESIKKEILDRWNKCKIRPEKKSSVERHVAIIVKNKERYKKVEAMVNIPWWWIAITHGMEGSFDFNTWLANGDPISAPTVHVPKGLKCDGTWENAAVVSLQHERFIGEKDWSIEHACYLWEAYNGFGYRSHGTCSQYVWSFTDQEMPGRYVADGVWKDGVWSDQVGCAAMLKLLIEKGVVSFEPTKPLPDNELKIVAWKINKEDKTDIRGYDAADRCVCYITARNIEEMYNGVLGAGAPRASFFIEALPKKIPVPEVLKKGSKGVAVEELQILLNTKFSSGLTVDGDFGPITEGVVKYAQGVLKLAQDGIVSAFVLEAIKKYLPSQSNATKFVEYFKVNFKEVDKEVERWFAGVYSPDANKNACVAHQTSCLKLCGLPYPKLDSLAAINVDYFVDWALMNHWRKIDSMAALLPGDICVSGPSATDLDHVYLFCKYINSENAEILDNQEVGPHSRSLIGVGCGKFRFALRMT